MDNKILTDVFLTESALNRIKELKQENEDVFIRVMITTGGCAGKQYHILMDDYIGDTDFVFQKNEGNKQTTYLVIDEVSLELLHNSTIDFSDDLEFSGFKIENPNITATCDCGNSFTCSGDCVVKSKDCKN